MKKHIITTSYTEFASDTELAGADLELLKTARTVAKCAYAPYSKFYVGAALRLENGIIVTGNNQENAAYPSGMCAERVAIFAAGANYPDYAIDSIAICCVTASANGKPFSPCGGCRQVLFEYENRSKKPMRIILGGMTGIIYLISSVKDLLPLSFVGDFLKK
ncbi:MAG: cytidine deaminase [Bacteroidetes bacterium]|nr:cytidine deaminase [Bacteroidota bacterium]PHX82554.1 MAG: cytidine deaminase [Flavobacteriales bacterium]